MSKERNEFEMEPELRVVNVPAAARDNDDDKIYDIKLNNNSIEIRGRSHFLKATRLKRNPSIINKQNKEVTEQLIVVIDDTPSTQTIHQHYLNRIQKNYTKSKNGGH
jgi:hypothetical protein